MFFKNKQTVILTMKRKKLLGFDFKRKLERKGSSSIVKLDTQPMTFSNASIDEGCH